MPASQDGAQGGSPPGGEADVIRLPPLPAGAILYPFGAAVDGLLAGFAATLTGRGFRVGGLVQRNTAGVHAGATLMELVDVATGVAVAISQNLGAGSVSCRVDPGGVAEASLTLRRALVERVDLLVVNKFATLEKDGRGLAPEILAALAEGIPVLIGVGSRFFGEWQVFCGGASTVLPPEMAALWRWWGAERLYPDLAHAAAAVAGERRVAQVLCRPPWLLLLADDGSAGVARIPGSAAGGAAGQEPDGAAQAVAHGWIGHPLHRVAAGVAESWEPWRTALGVAAVNAALNTPAALAAWKAGPDSADSADSADSGNSEESRRQIADAGMADFANGLDAFADLCSPSDAPLVAVGRFAGLRGRRPGTQVLTAHPAIGEMPLAAAGWLLPRAGAVLLSAAGLADRSLPGLLRQAAGRPVALVGPDTPLSARLFSYGLSRLSGRVIVNGPALVAAWRAADAAPARRAALAAFSHRVNLSARPEPPP